MGTRIDFDLRCVRCGENLRGLTLGECCAGCGLSAGESLNTRILDPTTADVSTDVACCGCGYNLKTLALGALCPECAEPVHKSLLAGDLRFADPLWLKTIHRGLILTAWFFALGLVQELFFPLVAIAGGFLLYLIFVTSTVRWIVSIGSMALWCAGLVFLGIANPSQAKDPRDQRWRFWIRLLGIVALAGVLVDAAYLPAVNWFVGGTKTAAGEYASDSWPPGFTVIHELLISPLGICVQIGALLLALHLRRTAGLPKGVRGLLAALAITSGLYATVELVDLLISHICAQSIPIGSGPSPPSGLRILSSIVSATTTLLSLGFNVLGLAAVLRMRRVVFQALRRQSGS